VKKILVCSLICMVVFALTMPASAASKKGIVTTQNGRQTVAPQAKVFIPYVDDDAPLKTIYNNLGSAYPLGVYWCCTGGTISGPNSVIGDEFWDAAGFTPKADATVTKVKVAVGYVTGNVTHVIVTLSADNGGIPGKVLKKWKADNLPAFGSCCTVTTKKNAGVKVKAGTLYWVTVQTENDSDIWAAWNLNDTDQVTLQPTAFAQDGVWSGGQGAPTYAFAVLGN
jgi:hypothetical protein